MSAAMLHMAAVALRGQACAASPGPWSAADEHGLLGPEAWPAWCVSQMRPGYESMSEREGYITDIADVHGDSKEENPNAEYIATMHPGVGLALADWLERCANRADHTSRARLEHDPEERDWYEPALAIARLILGGAS